MTTINEVLEAADEFAAATVELVAAAVANDDDAINAAVRKILEAKMAMVLPAPEGVEFDMHVFIVAPGAGIETRLAFPGNRMIPPQEPGPIDVMELIDSLGVQESRRLRAYGSDWRVMTRDEITAYKRRQIQNLN